MNVTGIVAEYNPFHKGHEYQLKRARELSNCDGVTVVMSGNYVQRGEPAIIDKFKRAEAAIYGGADLVIELPMPFSCQSAEYFAYGAINELKKLPVTHLSFGCENDDIKTLRKIALLQINNDNYNRFVREELAKGVSHPKAVANAIENFIDNNSIINYPNNVLGIEYIKNSYKLNCNWTFVPIKRIGSNHNDEKLTGQYDSATAIRKNIINNSNNLHTNSLTSKSLELINKFHNEFNGFNNLNSYLDFIYYKILELGIDGLNDIYEVSEGLNNKIYSNVYKSSNTDDYIMSIKSKRYTYSKIRRILLNILLDIKKKDISNFMLTNKCSNNSFNTNYVKVLAFNDTGRKIIKKAKDNGTYIINKYSDYKKYNIDLNIFNLTNKCTNIYYLPFNNRVINQEYYQNAYYIKN